MWHFVCVCLCILDNKSWYSMRVYGAMATLCVLLYNIMNETSELMILIDFNLSQTIRATSKIWKLTHQSWRLSQVKLKLIKMMFDKSNIVFAHETNTILPYRYTYRTDIFVSPPKKNHRTSRLSTSAIKVTCDNIA